MLALLGSYRLGVEWDRRIQATGINDFYRRLLEELRITAP